ncbi:DUF882 domain-containing protein [Aquamicrobium ahrensii]|uniref:Murein endopeptidase K n=1 Tax=Aquamicrobium ahrensii TaxID=469551 RepID=A0ABV2KLF5_9HYPH
MNRSERHRNGRHPCGSITRWLAAAVCAFGLYTISAPAAQAEVRALKLHNLHTKEKAEIVFKRNGRYDQAGLKKLNVFLRDWRRNEPTKMDPRLLDLVWEAYRATGSREYIHVVSAYRSPATNSMLRGRSKGVAQKSQHMLGKAMDFFVPGVPLKKLRDIGLKMQGGGVGYYPTSGSPFVHMDVGNVRHWPGISRQELASVFPNGKTLHVPSDGKPLPGYDQALAAYKSRSAAGAPAIALAGPTTSGSGRAGKSGGLLAALFGGGADEEEDNGVAVAAAPAPKKPVATAAKKPAAGTQGNPPGIAVISPDQANRAQLPQLADEPPETPETIIAALPVRSIPVPGAAPRPKTDVGVQTPDTVPFGVADVSPVQTAALRPTPENVPFAQASDEPAPQMASNDASAAGVPVPSFRPQHAPASDNAPALLALASEEAASAAGTLAVMPSARPGDEVKALLEEAGEEEYQIAAIPTPRSAFADPAGVDAAPASPRAAAIAQPSDPAGAVGGSVKTTRKAARPTAEAAKSEPRAVVVSAEPKLARWALNSGDYVVKASNATTAPRYAYNLVRTAPTEVYTTGFQARNQLGKAHQFTGTAVNFLSVARFESKVN